MNGRKQVKLDHHGDVANATRYGDLGETQADMDACEWCDISPRVIWLFIAALAAAGDAAMFTTTRQGGIGVTIFNGDARVKLYSNDAGNMEGKLGKATDVALLAVPPLVRDKLVERQSEW